jgi:hypothetical protein
MIAAVLLLAAALPAAADTRLVVFEAQGCELCARFRADVLPAFWGAAGKERVPMTLVDVDALGTAGFPLAHRLSHLPTVVLMQDGRERGRIEGLVGREELMQLILRMQALPAE